MQYILLVYENTERWSAISKDEKNQIHDDCTLWHEELLKSGRSQVGVALQPSTTATTVRENQGHSILTDGPFAETKEVLAGYEIVECQDLDEAIAIAKRFPALRIGFAMEVRPVRSNPCHEE